MPISLLDIQDFLQPYAKAIASILNVEVTVVDKALTRVAGTSFYEAQIGSVITHADFYQGILQKGEPSSILKSDNPAVCSTCSKQSHCKELADIGYPIKHEGEIIGVLGLVAFTQKAKNKLLSKDKHYTEFLKYMTLLLETKLSNQKETAALSEKLDGVMSVARKEAENDTHFSGASPAILDIIQLVKKVASSDSTILLTGESGTGKDVMAKVIHGMSLRSDRIMVSLNCAAIPESLIEAELFGYDRGAFTGAVQKGQMGKFELADRSTIFLDEIGEMSLATQTKLLRILQEKVFFRLGGNTPIPVDVRVICATNQNLEDLVAQGRFRKDLYYRINVIPIHLPPLRERGEDILLQAHQFLAQFNEKMRKNVVLDKPEVIELFKLYSWPGNTRELKNMVEYLVNICDDGSIEVEDLPGRFISLRLKKENEVHSLKTLIAEQERRLLRSLLEQAPTLEDKKKLAEKLDISLSSLYRKMAQYAL